MDYELFHQLIFSNPKQAEGFGRKLAVYILNAFILEFKSIELIIKSKPSEWLNMEGSTQPNISSFLKLITKSINYLVQRTLDPMMIAEDQ